MYFGLDIFLTDNRLKTTQLFIARQTMKELEEKDDDYQVAEHDSRIKILKKEFQNTVETINDIVDEIFHEKIEYRNKMDRHLVL